MIVSKATKQILVPYEGQVRALWPSAQIYNHDNKPYAVLPHTPRTQVQLRAAGIEAPAPILFHYDWEGGTPFQIQKNTAALATSHQRSYILNDLGTGKTRSALWSWKYLHQVGAAKRLLVVAPLSTLKFVWAREITLTLPGVRAAVLHGTRQQRLDLLKGDYDVYIINHDGLKSIAEELYARKDIDFLILDELAVYRNSSQRSKLMREFAQRFVWLIGMTGRPMPNSPCDVWGQAKILTPQLVPKYFRHARSLLMTQVSQFQWVPKEGAIDTALTWMQPNVRYSLDDVVELPEAIYRTVDVELSEEQARAYRKQANEFAVMIKDQRITAANAGVNLGKLLQIAAGFVYTTDHPQYVALDSEPRQQMLLELLDEAPHKVIVFAPWRHLIENLSALFTKNDVEHAVIHGDTKHRELILSDFQNTSRYRVLLAHPATLHHGITATAATTIIWYSPVTSLEQFEQANARIRRYGQQNKQLYLHLQSTKVERRVYSLLRTKARLQDEFLALIKTSVANGDLDDESKRKGDQS